MHTALVVFVGTKLWRALVTTCTMLLGAAFHEYLLNSLEEIRVRLTRSLGGRECWYKNVQGINSNLYKVLKTAYTYT